MTASKRRKSTEIGFDRIGERPVGQPAGPTLPRKYFLLHLTETSCLLWGCKLNKMGPSARSSEGYSGDGALFTGRLQSRHRVANNTTLSSRNRGYEVEIVQLVMFLCRAAVELPGGDGDGGTHGRRGKNIGG